MWMKFFSWMRLFKPLSAFIRMVSEILNDVSVFFQVLMLSLAAFANIIYILNINHEEEFQCDVDGEACDAIYETAFGNQLLDSMLHAYLTGLGDFRTDTYE